MAEKLPDEAPPIIPGFSRLEHVSSGGQAVVYSAIQDSTHRRVAIKISRDRADASPLQRQRFEREIELLTGLRHPNVVAIFDSGTTRDGFMYYVMDYVPGERLDEYVRGHDLGLRSVVELFATIADAVNFAHQHGVIHRDLKPGNILVDADGRPYVLDFGLAKRLLASEEEAISRTGTIVGTVPYFAPEQARGATHEVDTRTDVYALGRTLYELLTGSTPYPTRGTFEEVARHIESTAPQRMRVAWTPERGVGSATGVRASSCPIDRDLDAVVGKSLEKAREDRYQSAGEFALDLRRALAREPVDALRHRTGYVLRKFLLRSRRASATIAAVLIAMLATIVILALHLRNQRLAFDLARREQVHLTELDESPAGIVRYDGDGQTVYSNAAAQRMIGATESVLREQNWKRGIPAWRQGDLESAALELEATRLAQERIIVQHRSTFGRDMSFIAKYLPARDARNGFLLMMIDRMDLRRSEEVLSRIVSVAATPAFIVDLDEDRVVLASGDGRRLVEIEDESGLTARSASALLTGLPSIATVTKSTEGEWHEARLGFAAPTRVRSEADVDWHALKWREHLAVAIVVRNAGPN